MIRESSSIESDITDSISIKEMLILSIITSIDALSIGITFSLLNINIFISCIIIFIITFILSCIGIKIGYMFGSKYKSKTQIIGGVILIIMGIKFII
jgi:putative Mn2+ efflux pump MntP